MAALKTYLDQELVALLRQGSEAAYTEIYNRYKNLLQNHAYKKLEDFDEVKDVLQELFTQLWVKREELPETTNLRGYLYITMRNKIFNIIAHRKVTSAYIQSLQEFIREENYITDLLVREKEFKAMIDKEIDALPAKMQKVFRLSRDSGLSHREIAEQLDISEQTVSKQISNAIKVLRVKLGAFFFMVFL
jgi:RNA polymerase sigma-70 factor (ECF subfamily)